MWLMLLVHLSRAICPKGTHELPPEPERLVAAGLTYEEIVGSTGCVSSNARRYLVHDEQAVVRVDAEGTIRTHHRLTWKWNRDAIARTRAEIAELQTALRTGAPDSESLKAKIKSLRRSLREDRRQASWHRFWWTMNRWVGRKEDESAATAYNATLRSL